MARTIHKTEPVQLEGYQAILKPSEYGYSMGILCSDASLIEKLEEERVEELKYQESQMKNPRRKVVNPEPWEEVADGKYLLKFRWDAKNKPGVVDTEGTAVTDPDIPLWSGSTVRVAFQHGGYTLPNGTTTGTKLYIKGIQIISLNGGAGVDVGDLSEDDVAEIFGTTKGYKATQPNVIADEPETEAASDF
jgi:hypothetical protein